MDRHDEHDLDRDRPQNLDTGSSTAGDGESHATTGGAAAAGAVTGGVIGLAGGPVGAAIGAVGGAIVGAAAERMMHSDDDAERASAGLDNDRDRNPLIEDRAKSRPLATDTSLNPSARTEFDTTAATTAAATNLDTPSAASRADVNYGSMSTSSEFGTARTDLGATDTTARTDTGETMQLREEQLQARTTPVETGQVHIGKEVVEEQRTMDVPVSREEAVIERHPVDRRPSDQPIGAENRTIEMPLREERVEVDKQPVVYEEVGINKERVTNTQQVSDTVRREEARIEREGDVDLRNTDTDINANARDIDTKP
jgi:uncharacterized protein (TIGR02271 family)